MSFQVEDGDDATRDAPAMVSSHYEIERLKELQGFAEKKTVNSRPSWGERSSCRSEAVLALDPSV